MNKRKKYHIKKTKKFYWVFFTKNIEPGLFYWTTTYHKNLARKELEWKKSIQMLVFLSFKCFEWMDLYYKLEKKKNIWILIGWWLKNLFFL
jgi:hypothetical protein